MKKTTLIWLLGGFFVASVAGSGFVGWYTGIHAKAISRGDAIGYAMNAIGPAVVRNARLDRYDGKPVWEINFSQPGQRGVVEVRVHALTGNVVAIRTESEAKANEEIAEVIHNLGFTVKVPELERKPPPSPQGEHALTTPFSPALKP
jgi:hypothetical protein